MMFYRQKFLLALLEAIGTEVNATRLQKCLFLATRDSDRMYYDFVPYYYGCFSFQAQQDLISLNKKGVLVTSERANGQKYVRLTSGCNDNLFGDSPFLSAVKDDDRECLRQIATLTNRMSNDNLIRHTYKNYPFYATRSKIAESLLSDADLKRIVDCRPKDTSKCLFSIGYEGRSLESFLNILIKNNVRILCDVRKNAYSQKFGFSKSTLEKGCKGTGIKYIHIPALGIESDKRGNLNSQADYDSLFEYYEENTLPYRSSEIEFLCNLLNSESRVALMCFEKLPEQCHRTRVANAVRRNVEDLKFTNL